MFNLKNDLAYSKALKKLILYLTKNRPNLNRYILVRPYHLLENLAKKYNYDKTKLGVYVKNNIHTYFPNTSTFKLDGWNVKYGLNIIHLPFLSTKHKKLYNITINPYHLSITDTYNLGKETNYSYKFSIQHTSNKDYLDMDWDRLALPSNDDIIDCFINSVKVLYTFMQSELKTDKQIYNTNTDIKKHKNIKINQHKQLLNQQKKNIENGKYSWNKIFN